MSEPETPAPEQVTVDPNAAGQTAPELDVSAPVPPPEPAPLPAEPAPEAVVETTGAPPAEVIVETPPVNPMLPYSDTLNAMLEELRDLKQRIAAVLQG